jgi:hypothetical protein
MKNRPEKFIGLLFQDTALKVILARLALIHTPYWCELKPPTTQPFGHQKLYLRPSVMSANAKSLNSYLPIEDFVPLMVRCGPDDTSPKCMADMFKFNLS